MKRRITFSALVILSLATASAAESSPERLTALKSSLQSDPTNTLILFQLGDLCHDLGANDDKKAVVLAEGYFKRLLALDPDNAMARALYGSVLTMKARDSRFPLARLTYVKTGNREMDAAVSLAPKDARIHFTRAINNFHMPDFMDRGGIVQEDLAWLWEQAQFADTKLDLGQKQTIALRYGQILRKKKKLGEAIKVWRAGLALAPKSQDAAPLMEQLAINNPRSK